MFGKFLGRRKVVKEVLRYDGPGAKKGDECAYFNIYVYDDDSCKTIEFNYKGAHVAEYDGEPHFPDDARPKQLAETEPPTTRPEDRAKAVAMAAAAKAK